MAEVNRWVSGVTLIIHGMYDLQTGLSPHTLLAKTWAHELVSSIGSLLWPVCHECACEGGVGRGFWICWTSAGQDGWQDDFVYVKDRVYG